MAVSGLSAALALKMDFAMRNTNLLQNDTPVKLTGLAMYLVRDGLLNTNEATDAMHTAAQQGMSLTSYLFKHNILSSEAILTCCTKYFELPLYDLKKYDRTILKNPVIHADLIYRYRVIPLHRDEHSLSLGITDPTDHIAVNAISFHTGLRVRPLLVSEADLDNILSTHAQSTQLDSQLETTLAKIAPVEEPLLQEMSKEDDGPISAFVDKLIQDALQKNVSDIHIEPSADYCRIRFRCDGMLSEAMRIPSHLAMRVITRLKILAHLNIAERRLPQDGRMPISQQLKIDTRISTCPTLYGEKIVLRLLNGEKNQLDLDAIGLTHAQKALFIDKLTQPQGLILVTGPTGSGKTITLYAALHYLNKIEKNILSVEDPVEIEFMGINQVNIHPRIGLDFASVLRAFLRQDPDIIMVGEIRDAETSQIATQAAQTGHLVLSTLHTNSALEALFRLQSMGTTAHHFISSVSLIIAQRLVRKLCQHCKQPDILPTHTHDDAVMTYRAIGCEHCSQGYHGRIGIFELIPITEKMAQKILLGTHVTHLLEQMKEEGWITLCDAGLEKVQSGITSQKELMRVVGHPF